MRLRRLRRQPPAPAIQTMRIPAPVGGLNTLASGSAVPDGDCLQCFNLISGEHGLRVRSGYHQWNSVPAGVRTMIPYRGSAADGSLDRLFAVTAAGIYDVTTQTASGTSVLSFTYSGAGLSPSSVNGLAGYGSFQAVTTSGGHFLLYCDEVNGYHVYTESTDTWAKVTEGGGGSQVSGVDPGTFCDVVVWKSRVWFVQRNTAKAWYLAAGAIYGTATSLNLDRSAQFRNGGGLRALANWTLDGGIGIDDHLVAISDGGDVAIYQGTDPASASTFSLKGTWSTGGIPAGRRIVTKDGGDVLLLTKSGVRPLSQLVAGQDGIGTYATAKIANLFSSLASTQSGYQGWALCQHPEDNALLVLVPQSTDAANNNPTDILAMSLWNRSWSRYRDLEMTAACAWHGKLYFGDTSGVVWLNEGYVDNRLLGLGDTFDAIQWQVLTPFRNNGGRQTQVQLIRPIIKADEVASFSAEARYTFDMSELSDVTQGSDGEGWDVGTWDVETWDDNPATQKVRGTTGVGTDVAISVRGAATASTVLAGIDVMYTVGGLL